MEGVAAGRGQGARLNEKGAAAGTRQLFHLLIGRERVARRVGEGVVEGVVPLLLTPLPQEGRIVGRGPIGDHAVEGEALGGLEGALVRGEVDTGGAAGCGGRCGGHVELVHEAFEDTGIGYLGGGPRRSV